MLRSIRIPILASFVALIFVACGGGNSNPPIPDGGTQQDGNHIQFDAQHDGLPPQEDGPQVDGATGGCVASGGVATAGICKASKPCTCPNDCAYGGAAPAAGSCFPIYNGTACDNSTDVPAKWTGETDGHCFPSVTVNGSFSVPIGTQATAGGTVTGISVTLNGQTFTPTNGFVAHNTSTSTWDIILLQTGTSAVTGFYFGVPDANYIITTPVTFGNSGTGNFQIETNSGTADIMYGSDYSGSLTLTTADTGASGTAAGTITNLVVFGVIIEFCGPNSTPC